LLSHADARGRFRGITNSGYQLYVAAYIPYGLKPSVDIAISMLLKSLAFFGYLVVNFFHAKSFVGCIILSS
jgi:hypothetical protein